MRLENKTAIITGAASGMGAEEARVFASEGARGVVADLSDDLGQSIVDEIKQAGGEAHYAHLDVRNEDEWAALLDEYIDRFGPWAARAGTPATSPQRAACASTRRRWHSNTAQTVSGSTPSTLA